MPILPAILALATTSTPHLSATRIATPPVLDGRLDDPVWQQASASDTFTQKLPDGGKPSTERTVVRILYDDDAVYVGIDCEQRRSEVVGRLTRRDRDVEADKVSVSFDTRGDGKTAFEFVVNPAGVLVDGLHFNDTNFSQEWDENWEAKTAVSPRGWSVEFRIPLRVLRFSARPVQSWGLQVQRWTSMTQEADEWAYIPRDVAGEVSHYGRLDNLVGLRPKSPFEIRPFVAGSLRHYDPESSNLARGFAPGFSAGLDLKWHISQELTLDAAFLPDFGQVEADQVVLNLTTFEQYLPEKRPFFLEGAETFNTPFQLLYTRRIGRAPDVPVLRTDPPFSEQLIDNPTPSRIDGAVKLVGELGGRFSVGELVAVTGSQTVSVQPGRGEPVERLVDPLTTYKVLRIKRELGDHAHVGVTAMATNRLESFSAFPTLPGAGPGMPTRARCPQPDALGQPIDVPKGARCFHDAYVGSLDAHWRSPSGEYVISGQAVGTMIQNGPPRTLLDGTEIKSGDIAPAISVMAAKEGGTFTYQVDYVGHGRKVDYNDLGFMERQNRHRFHGEVAFNTLKPRGPTLETRTWLSYAESDNLDLLSQGRSLWLANFTKYKNFWGVYTEIKWRPHYYDDREMGDGAALERPALFGAEAEVVTDSRKRVSGALWSQLHFIDHDGIGFQGNARVSFRVLPQFDVDLLPSWVYAAGEPRFFGTQDSAYLFGRLRAQGLGLTLRSTYTFTPQLTLQAYAQLFVDSWHYTDFTSAPANGKGAVVRLADLRPHPPPAVDDNPDFQSGTLNASLVLRWEYRLGSTLYVVYSHGQGNTVTPGRGEGTGFDFRRAAPRAAEDSLLVKLAYWWGG
jgi:hypothetical protein